MSTKIIDSFEFCRQSQQLSGKVAIAEFPRLSAELTDNRGELSWSFAGGRHETGSAQLTMQVHGEVRLMCQRCLTPYAFPVVTKSFLVLAHDDGEADEIEARLDDDSIDVIVASSALDLMVLVEDEVLLALPLSPRHAHCPDGAAAAAVNEKPESPFAVLKKLKQ
jgi:uncharacterized protein